MISSYIALTKPKIIVLLLITALGGLFLASDGFPDPVIATAVLVGGSLAAGGANSLNHFWDRDIDAKMKRTTNRPVASGVVAPANALVFGAILNLMAFGLLYYYANLLSALLTLSATLFYLFVYTMILKRTTPLNIVIGGAAGSIPPAVGWAAVTGNILDPAPLFLFLIVFFWTPPHFWALSLILKDDYANAGVPMLPVVSGVPATKTQIFIYTWILLALLVATVYFVEELGIIFGISAIVLSAGFIGSTWLLKRRDSIELAMPIYLYSMAYLALLFMVMVVESFISV
ncbi:MAG: protoheme IX farnesyltransferase [SAR202 cluster bacterium]|jgi:protoheme IX farnesyltransferase|nr:protoheme IX farnesyltransferase [SAR202 cluster bacterium]|tara:strand:+ start:45095 stop:45958 length:864 start_codon:yes stop_codon:yes gene_type:complete